MRNKSTHHANKIYLEKIIWNKLALNANRMKKKGQEKFAKLIDKSIDEAGLKKKNVAEEADIHPTSLSRIIACEQGIADNTAIDLIRAINTLANRNIIDETFALSLIGRTSADNDVYEILDGVHISFSGNSVINESQQTEFIDSVKVLALGTIIKDRIKESDEKQLITVEIPVYRQGKKINIIPASVKDGDG